MVWGRGAGGGLEEFEVSTGNRGVKMYVYIILCRRTGQKNFGDYVYYAGLTSDPKRRLYEHCNGIKSNWMKRYKIHPKYFVYIEQVKNYREAIKREKQIKRLSRRQKQQLINEYNAVP